MAEQFKIAVEQAMGKTLDKQVADRKVLQDKLQAGFDSSDRPAAESKASKEQAEGAGGDNQQVEGFKMEQMNQADEDTSLTSSGVHWLASAAVLLLIMVFVVGMRGFGRRQYSEFDFPNPEGYHHASMVEPIRRHSKIFEIAKQITDFARRVESYRQLIRVRCRVDFLITSDRLIVVLYVLSTTSPDSRILWRNHYGYQL